jgi:PAS domain S-box-containing protein
MERQEDTIDGSPLAALAQPVLDALTLSVAVLDEEGTIVAVNEAWRVAARAAPGDRPRSLVGENYFHVCEATSGQDADVAARAAAGIRSTVSGKTPDFLLEYPCHGPGRRRWFMLRVTRFTQGGRNFAVTAHEDITERKLAEEQIRFLLSELSHRAKNLLAIVQSIARHTARDRASQEFAHRLGERLRSLAASQDAIIHGDWDRVAVANLVRSQLSHLGEAGGARVHAEGDLVLLRPAAAQAIGMALHELATNAMKYGSLSDDKGEVDIAWSLVKANGERRFRISWTERGGPAIKKPKHRGFGRTVIEQMAVQAVGGHVELRYDPSGLRWVLEAPEREVVSSPGRRP